VEGPQFGEIAEAANADSRQQRASRFITCLLSQELHVLKKKPCGKLRARPQLKLQCTPAPKTLS